MVGCRNQSVDLRTPKFQGASYQDPIDRSRASQIPGLRCSPAFITKEILKLIVPDKGRSNILGQVEIEVASKHDGGQPCFPILPLVDGR